MRWPGSIHTQCSIQGPAHAHATCAARFQDVTGSCIVSIIRTLLHSGDKGVNISCLLELPGAATLDTVTDTCELRSLMLLAVRKQDQEATEQLARQAIIHWGLHISAYAVICIFYLPVLVRTRCICKLLCVPWFDRKQEANYGNPHLQGLDGCGCAHPATSRSVMLPREASCSRTVL
jgi:hypothetical protein